MRLKLFLRYELIIALLIIIPSPAHAYVDPGLVGGLYQVLYASILIFISTYIFRPFQYIRSLFQRKENWYFLRDKEFNPTKELPKNANNTCILKDDIIYFIREGHVVTMPNGLPLTYKVSDQINYNKIKPHKRYLVHSNKNVFKIYREAIKILDNQTNT